MREYVQHAFEFKFPDNAAPGTFEGYGAVFGNVDSHGDLIVKGAFRNTLRDWKARKSLPKMLLQHGFQRDGIPIGKWDEMAEDDHGLHVRGRLINLDTEAGKQLHGAMKEGVLDELSIGYVARDAKRGVTADEPLRTLKAVDLMEVSIVTFASNGRAKVTSVKSIEDVTIREFERGLVDGTLPPLSEKQAKALLAEGFKGIKPERDATADYAELAEILRKNIRILT